MAKSTKRRLTQVGPKKTRRVVGKGPNPQQVRSEIMEKNRGKG